MAVLAALAEPPLRLERRELQEAASAGSPGGPGGNGDNGGTGGPGGPPVVIGNPPPPINPPPKICIPPKELINGKCKSPVVKPPNNPPPVTCNDGEILKNGKCIPTTPIVCPTGQHLGSDGKCVPDNQPPPTCPAGEHLDTKTNKCVPDSTTTTPPPCDPAKHTCPTTTMRSSKEHQLHHATRRTPRSGRKDILTKPTTIVQMVQRLATALATAHLANISTGGKTKCLVNNPSTGGISQTTINIKVINTVVIRQSFRSGVPNTVVHSFTEFTNNPSTARW